MLKINNKDITGVFIGSNSIHRIYLGQDVVWEKYTFPTDGLQHYWNLDETSGTIAYDSINNKNIRFNDINALNNFGKNNTGAFSFNLIYGDSAPLSQNFSSPYNISFWFYVDPSSSLGVSRLINLGTPTQSKYYGIRIYLNNYTFNINFGNGTVESSGGRRSYLLSNAFVKGMWHHVSLNVVSLYDITLFINGVNTNISYNSGSASSVNYGNKIFSLFRNGTYTETDNVYIDEVGIWNRTLTLEEVQALYNYGNGSFYIKIYLIHYNIIGILMKHLEHHLMIVLII